MRFRYDSRGMGQWLRGPDCRAVLEQAGAKTLANYQAVVARRTGALAASTRMSVGIGGVHKDRLVATVTATVPYAASHEFGTKGRDRQAQIAANEMAQALAMLGRSD